MYTTLRCPSRRPAARLMDASRDEWETDQRCTCRAASSGVRVVHDCAALVMSGLWTIKRNH
eukprot:938307-Alexandrium_andersonii.AAC.1